MISQLEHSSKRQKEDNEELKADVDKKKIQVHQLTDEVSSLQFGKRQVE